MIAIFVSLVLGVLPQILGAWLVISLVSYVYNNYSKNNLWKKQGVPGPNPWLFPFKRNLSLFDKKFYTRDIDYIKKYGKIYGVNDGERMSLIVGDPEALKILLVKDFNHFLNRRGGIRDRKYFTKFLTQLNGSEWKSTRSIMSPTFTSGKIKAMIHLMKQCLTPLIARINRTLGQDVDMKDLFGCFTMDVIAKTAFALELDTHDDKNHPFVTHAKKFLTFKPLKMAVFFLSPAFIRKLFKLSFMDLEAGEYLCSVGQHMLNQRRKSATKAENRRYNDFLQLMTEASEDGQTGDHGGKKTLTDEEIVGNIVLLLVAGFETTATTLSLASYNLAIHPDVQEKVFQEVTDATTANGGVLDYDTLMSLTYLDAVIHETLRMYPPVIRTERTCSEDYTFNYDGKSIFMPKGSGVGIPIYAIHHMEEYYPDPETFKPERFLPENKDSINSYAFLSFVIGPRNCIGMRFALMEAKLALATIISDFKFVTSPLTSIPLDLSGTIALMNPREVILRLEKREH